MKNPVYAKAALAALFIGVGVALFASVMSDVRNAEPCVDCGETTPEETAQAVAEASADLNGDSGEVTPVDDD